MIIFLQISGSVILMIAVSLIVQNLTSVNENKKVAEKITKDSTAKVNPVKTKDSIYVEKKKKPDKKTVFEKEVKKGKENVENEEEIPHAYDSFTDTRDSQVYKFIRIGDQVWMAENLNYKTDNSWCVQCKTYGRLYNNNEARVLCPKGWHLPNDADWFQLFVYLAGLSSSSSIKLPSSCVKWNELFNYLYKNKFSADMLKSAHGWKEPYSATKNLSGFSAIPGEQRSPGGEFYHIARGSWWSASRDSYGVSYFYQICPGYGDVFRGYCDNKGGFSVRCIRDTL